jgi:lipopolysaccharide exporter
MQPDDSAIRPGPGPSAGIGSVADPTPELPEPKLPRRKDLRRRVAQGTLINAAFNIGLNGLNLVKGFVAAAFLTTTEYGVWGLLFVSLGTLVWLKQVGVGDKYIQQDDPDQELAFQKAFTLELMLTTVFTLFVLSIVPLITAITGHPELIAPGVVLAMAFPALFLQSPLWVFYREMDFLRQRTLQAVDPIVAAVVTIALAIAGAGYWSLIIGLVAGNWVGAAVAVLASPYPLRLRYDRGTMRSYLDFSWPLFVAAIASLVLPQGSVLVGNEAVGLAGVGAIALAVTVAQFAERVDQIVTTTIYPAICTVRDDLGLLFESFVKSNRLALMWGVPFGVGLALFAPDLVEFGIGDRWRPAVGLIQVFGLIAAANQLGFNWDAYFRARGDTKPIAAVSVVTMLAFLAATVPLLLAHGLDGFAIGMAIVTVVGLFARSFFLTRLFSGFAMLQHAARAIAPTLPAVAAVFAVRLVATGDRSLGLALAELCLYLGVTFAATVLFERSLLREIVSYLRKQPLDDSAGGEGPAPQPSPAGAAR